MKNEKKKLTLKELEEIFKTEQELGIPMKDRFHNHLADEQLTELTCTKESYPAKQNKEKELTAKDFLNGKGVTDRSMIRYFGGLMGGYRQFKLNSQLTHSVGKRPASGVDITPEMFLNAEFGKKTCRFSIDGNSQYEGNITGGDLGELLDEFKQIVLSKELGENRNPRTRQYTLIDTFKGIIIGSYQNSMLGHS